MQNASIEQLLELKKSFENLVPFWFDWVQYKHNGLDEIDVYIIETFRKKEFKFNPKDSPMFYYRKNIIENTLKKLELSYREFQDWVIVKFQVSLLNLFSEENSNSTLNELNVITDNSKSISVESFFDKEIQTLFLEEEIKKALLTFNCLTIGGIVGQFSEYELKEKSVFKNILNFFTVIQESKHKFSVSV